MRTTEKERRELQDLFESLGSVSSREYWQTVSRKLLDDLTDTLARIKVLEEALKELIEDAEERFTEVPDVLYHKARAALGQEQTTAQSSEPESRSDSPLQR